MGYKHSFTDTAPHRSLAATLALPPVSACTAPGHSADVSDKRPVQGAGPNRAWPRLLAASAGARCRAARASALQRASAAAVRLLLGCSSRPALQQRLPLITQLLKCLFGLPSSRTCLTSLVGLPCTLGNQLDKGDICLLVTTPLYA